jgi:hypothetical protein
MPEEEKKEQEQQQPTVTPEEVAELKNQLKAAQDRISQYEQMLLDPAYLEFLATQGIDTKGRKVEQQQVDLDNMSQKDLVEYILASVKGLINEAITPLKQEATVNAAVAQVKEAAAKYPDFWEYRDEMIRLAKMHPSLTAEEAYHLAKAKTASRPKRPSKPAETPTGGAQMKRKPPEGFEAKFLEAWREAGFSKE